jgi:hypothetical protein
MIFVYVYFVLFCFLLGILRLGLPFVTKLRNIVSVLLETRVFSCFFSNYYYVSSVLSYTLIA